MVYEITEAFFGARKVHLTPLFSVCSREIGICYLPCFSREEAANKRLSGFEGNRAKNQAKMSRNVGHFVRF